MSGDAIVVVLSFAGYMLGATILAPLIWLLFSDIASWAAGDRDIKRPHHGGQFRFSDASTEGKILYGATWPIGVYLLGIALLVAFVRCVVISIVFLSHLGMKLAGQ